jgi:hypothetical protein
MTSIETMNAFERAGVVARNLQAALRAVVEVDVVAYAKAGFVTSDPPAVAVKIPVEAAESFTEFLAGWAQVRDRIDEDFAAFRAWLTGQSAL